jgi:hypothetical protein
VSAAWGSGGVLKAALGYGAKGPAQRPHPKVTLGTRVK